MFPMKEAPPQAPSGALLEAYTLNSSVPLAHFYIDDSAEGEGTHYRYDAAAVDEQLKGAHRLIGRELPPRLPPVGSSGFGNSMWLVRALRALSIAGLRVVVFGSIEPREQTLCLALGAAHVTTVDFNRLSFEHPSLTTITVDELASAPAEQLGFDLALSLSSFDHDGLGRYGDRLHPSGDLAAMASAWRALKPGGKLLLTVPVGPDVVVWNLHRRYGPLRLPLLLRGWEEVRRATGPHSTRLDP